MYDTYGWCDQLEPDHTTHMCDQAEEVVQLELPRFSISLSLSFPSPPPRGAAI
jgi:hypothetical protein